MGMQAWVVHREPADLDGFVIADFRLAACHAAPEDHVQVLDLITVRISHKVPVNRDTRQQLWLSEHASLLDDLANDGISRFLAGLDDAARQGPLTIV